MDHREVGRFWDGNAEAWTILSRQGYDVSRDWVNTPGFLRMLPDVRGLQGLDIGCGEGSNTRKLAERGAGMTAIDISPRFVRFAAATEAERPVGIHFAVASAVELPFGDGAFDFATSFVCFMDIPETGQVLAEAFRVLKSGGFLQFSITHPCYDTPHRRNLRDETGRTHAIEVGGYFTDPAGAVQEWSFSAAPPEARAGLLPFQVPVFHHTLSEWVNLLLDTGFVIERLGEPVPDEDAVRERPSLQDHLVVAYFLHFRARKPTRPGPITPSHFPSSAAHASQAAVGCAGRAPAPHPGGPGSGPSP